MSRLHYSTTYKSFRFMIYKNVVYSKYRYIVILEIHLIYKQDKVYLLNS